MWNDPSLSLNDRWNLFRQTVIIKRDDWAACSSSETGRRKK